MLQSYAVDSNAILDFRELRYQWFNHVLNGGPKPRQLQDRVNFEVMGANLWRSAGSIAAMATSSLRFYLDPSGGGESRRLSQEKIAASQSARLTVDLQDRRDAAWTEPTEFMSRSLAARNSVMYVSDPLNAPLQLNGLFSGRLDFTVNRVDMDLNISLYELTPAGDYIHLFNPTYEFRASYARDRGHRRLLHAGTRQRLPFASERLTSRQFQAGSRLVMVLGVSKRPDREINYGTGNDVSEESIEDAVDPIKIRWYGTSFLDIPVSH
jgi:predicted acyl esterase